MRKIAIGAVLLLLAACAPSKQAQYENVRNQWVTNLRAYGSLPIYPVRENAYTGDIYLYVNDACAATGRSTYSPATQSVWLGALPVDTLASLFNSTYGQRPELPETATPQKPAGQATQPPSAPGSGSGSGTGTPSTPQPKKTAAAAGGATKPPAGTTPPAATTPPTTPPPTTSPPEAAPAQSGVTPQPTGQIFPTQQQPLVFNRLRLAAFPSLSISTYEGASATAGLPIGSAISASAGAGSQNATQKTVTFSQIEVMDLPFPAIYSKAISFLQSDPNAKTILNPAAIDAAREQLLRMAHAAPAAPCSDSQDIEPVIIIPTRVYYTRQIDFEIGSNSEFAAELGASLQGVPTSKSGSQTPSTGNPAPAPPSGATGEAANAQALQQKLAALAGGGRPGGSFQLAIGSSGGLTLKETFDRPMAFMFDQPIIFRLSQAYALVANLKFDPDKKTYVCPTNDPGGYCEEAKQWLSAVPPQWAPGSDGSAGSSPLFFTSNPASKTQEAAAGPGANVPAPAALALKKVPVPAPAAAPAPAPAPALKYTVYFETGANLSPDAQKILDKVASAFKAAPNATLSLVGYSDLTGPQSARKLVSLNRAMAARDALVKDGVPKSAIMATGAGDQDPAVPTPDGVAEPRNRRVEITLH